METTQLFIPTKLKVGFVKRGDAFLKTLAYIVYYDSKGVLRKETSWENWRDKSIEPIEVDNTPHSGFILNKDVKRYNWSHYSSGRSMIRVYDDRGIEFEITPNNLLFILMNTNCYKRELEGEFVYAWDNKELVLLPTNCEEYKASTNFTQLQSGNITSKDIVPGYIYKTKKDQNLVYLGKFPWYEYSERKNYYKENRYVFIPESKVDISLESKDASIQTFTNLKHLAIQVSDSHIDNFAEKLVELNKTKYCSPPIGLVAEKITKEYILIDSSNAGYLFYYYRVVGIEVGTQTFDIYSVYCNTNWNPTIQKYEYDGNGYWLDYKTTIKFHNNKLSKTIETYYYYCRYGNSERIKCRNVQEIIDKYVNVKIELANGLKVNYYDY